VAALRALLFAVFGGFIGAAPASPVLPSHGDYADGATSQSQKREQPGDEVSAPLASSCAAAPPCSDTPNLAAGIPPAPAPRPVHFTEAPASACRVIDALPPSAEDIRAGLLDLPPPTR